MTQHNSELGKAKFGQRKFGQTRSESVWFLAGLTLLGLGVGLGLIEQVFYQGVDTQGYLLESAFLPLSVFFLVLSAPVLLVALIKLVRRLLS